ncbi:hypothetical protein SJI19_04165 [Acerihabitans sp. TG2]|uniref:hypothetical protein n=1 Tax=Acerihabitans sp. TG2 TaxID=3096008 RepID=UPI002B22F6FC|nr:hypothetical protein [Acerihabitans sp. TG2]MEA9389756.1 hypothetical protein [Acerihabitans sp. TG2]
MSSSVAQDGPIVTIKYKKSYVVCMLKGAGTGSDQNVATSTCYAMNSSSGLVLVCANGERRLCPPIKSHRDLSEVNTLLRRTRVRSVTDFLHGQAEKFSRAR